MADRPQYLITERETGKPWEAGIYETDKGPLLYRHGDWHEEVPDDHMRTDWKECAAPEWWYREPRLMTEADALAFLRSRNLIADLPKEDTSA